MAVHIDARDGAFAHADGGAAVAGDHAAQELEDIGVVADDKHALAVGILGQHLLEGRVIGIQAEGGTDFHFGFVAKLGADKLGCLESPLERAGYDDVDLDPEGGKNARHQHALLFPLLNQGSFGVEGGVISPESGVGVAH